MKEVKETKAETGAGDARELLVMRAGGLAFAVHADECECVTPWAEPAPLPDAPPPVLGVVSVRGRMRTVLDPVRLFEAAGLAQDSRPAAAPPRLIASLKGDEQLALAFETSRPATLDAGTGTTPAVETTPLAPLPVLATFSDGGETVQLLDASRLFDAAMSGTERRRRRSVTGDS